MLEDKTIISISTRGLYYNFVFKTVADDSSVTLSKAELDQYMQYFYNNSQDHTVICNDMSETPQVIFLTDHMIIECIGAIECYEDYINLFKAPTVLSPNDPQFKDPTSKKGYSKRKQL